MLLRNVPRKHITIYNRYGSSYIRTIVDNCILMKDTNVSFKSQGVLPLDTIAIYIFNYANYVSSYEYKGSGWTVTVGNESNNTYIVEGICNYRFKANDPKELSNEIRQFEKSYNYKRPKLISENFIGSDNMRHIMINC